MLKKSFAFCLFSALLVGTLSVAQAKGRQPPDEEKDSFPDYNRLEMRPKPRTPSPDVSAPAVTTSSAPPVNIPPAPPSLNTPVNPSPDEEDKPQPAPKAVPLPEGAGEPPMPDDISNTLIQGTTTTDQK